MDVQTNFDDITNFCYLNDQLAWTVVASGGSFSITWNATIKGVNPLKVVHPLSIFSVGKRPDQ